MAPDGRHDQRLEAAQLAGGRWLDEYEGLSSSAGTTGQRVPTNPASLGVSCWVAHLDRSETRANARFAADAVSATSAPHPTPPGTSPVDALEQWSPFLMPVKDAL